jgi:cobalt-precorrin-6B (C15)-methyltransferase
MKWIADEEFIRGNIPMTKFNARILAIAYLGIEGGDRFLDIGAGTGSISIEAALHGADVWAVEKEAEGVKLIHKNSAKFGVNINTIEGSAPYDMPDLKIDKCFIGGSGGKLKEIFTYLDKNLSNGGILCANFIVLKNLSQFMELLKEYKYENIELELVQSSYMDKIGLMKAQNPIYIAKGVKKDD